MMILNIETSTNVCSVALSENSNCLFSKINYDGLNHAALLSSFIDEALKHLKSIGGKLDAIAVSSGPGSYTGLRIGVSTAKGLCYGFEIPLIAVSTLEILTAAVRPLVKLEASDLLCPMIDARRMEVYDAVYMPSGEVFREISADIIDVSSFSELLDKHRIYFYGNGAEKLKNTLTHENVCFIDNIVPRADNMIEIAESAFVNKQFVDVAYFEPFYLKEFQATVPKAK